MVTIAVHGSSSRLLPAERGTVRLALEIEGDDRATVLEAVAALHERFVAEAAALVERGVATRWTSQQVWVRAEARWEGRDEQRRTVQIATAEVAVRFRDFEALSAWVLTAGAEPGVTVHRIEWAVTADHRAAAERELRVLAVEDALARAGAYASAIGGGGVRLAALWEAGLRPSASAQDGGIARAMSRMAEASAVELRPADIEIAAVVTADFVVEDRDA
jgi:uncharacterized protein